MRVLRSNKESVTAMLEAFVHDPLINWRLLNTTEAATEAALGRTAGPGDHADAAASVAAGVQEVAVSQDGRRLLVLQGVSMPNVLHRASVMSLT